MHAHRIRPIVHSSVLAASLLALGACAETGNEVAPERAEPQVDHRDDLTARFRQAGFAGGFALLDPAANRLVLVDAEACNRRYVPASTFKVFNALVALDTGVVPGPDFALPWDGVERAVPSWNQDHTLASAFQASALWYFQEIARRVGLERMREYLVAADYGNHTTSDAADLFWIDDSLQISPVEQAEFLARLHQPDGGALPFTERSRRIVLEIMELARSDDGAVLRGKTGWSVIDGRPDVGWFVGSVERDGSVCTFATVLVGNGKGADAFRLARRRLSEQLLADLGRWRPAGSDDPAR